MKILVVDDTEEMRDCTNDMLKDKHEIIQATNGAEALSIYTKNKPDIVLLDISMPVMDGLETLSKLLVMDNTARIIMLSAIEDDETIDNCLTKGALGYLSKPVTKDELYRTINSLSKTSQKYYTTIFSKATNDLYRSLTKLYPNVSISLLDVGMQEQERSTQNYNSTIDFSRLKVVPKTITPLKNSPTSEMAGFVTEFYGVHSGFISSFIENGKIDDWFENEKIDTKLEFFNIFNLKILSEFSNTINSSLKAHSTRIFVMKNDDQVPFEKIVKAQFEIIKNDGKKFEIETFLCIAK